MEAGTGGLGTLMRHVLELLDGDVARVYADLGVPDYRPRYSPVVRALVAHGPLSIRDLAAAVGVSHSAASQTAAQMARHGLLTLERSADARQRIARLTARARALLPLIEAEWAATDAAAAELEAELRRRAAGLGYIAVLARRRPARAHVRPGACRRAARRLGRRRGGPAQARAGRRPGPDGGLGRVRRPGLRRAGPAVAAVPAGHGAGGAAGGQRPGPPYVRATAG